MLEKWPAPDLVTLYFNVVNYMKRFGCFFNDLKRKIFSTQFYLIFLIKKIKLGSFSIKNVECR